MKKTLNKIGIRYGILGIWLILFDVFYTLFLIFFPKIGDAVGKYRSTLGTVISIYCIGFPLIWLITRNIPGRKLEKQSLSFKMFMLYLLMTFGCEYIGNMVGLPLHLVCSLPSGMGGMTGLFQIMFNVNPIVTFIVTSICAPIFEELICRKIVVDKLSAENEYVAIVTSGLIFAILHGNFQQGAFTFLVGCLWAYIYLRTGRIIYTMCLHSIMNTATSAVTVPLLRKAMSMIKDFDVQIGPGETIMDMLTRFEQVPDADIIQAAPYFAMIYLWLFILGALMIGGCVVLIIFRAKKKIALTPEEKVKVGKKKDSLKTLFTAPGMWVYYAVGIIFLIQTYVLPIFY